MAVHALKRVVITGIGATTPLGGDAPSTWEALLAGRSGARRLPYEWVVEYDLPVQIGAPLAVSASESLSKVEQRRQDPCAQYALIAAREAWADAGSPDVAPERLAVSIGSGVGGVQTLVNQWENLRTKGPRRVFPLSVPMLLVNSPTATVSLELNARGGGHTPVSACASGAEGIAMGLDMIRQGRADVVVAGGTEAAIHPLPIGGFAAMQALSTRNGDPERASRPYDLNRDGFLIGEGSALMVLESYESALARGAKIYAELVSAGITTDAHHVAAPEPDGAGAAAAISWALTAGRISPDEVAHINAHATSTPVGDLAEAKAIRSALGPVASRIPVSATKSMTGHLLGAAGSLEAIFTVLALRDGQAPAQINLDDPDPSIELDIVSGASRELPTGDIVALDNSFGFGGHNVVLAFRRCS
ncbi:3-oxoacyl-[acyl-carrier-protein] synthase II [Austwickia chelonae]|uniref:3-oxoacyl-[acyl-carrier-protein] synthase 2 n=1 Tax=Austwickia chelonae NBRC 105200 TaxID=1184607 RepID=K6V518_9MICO|nr:beta-ketoacyl-[acyl-carrier-protein] synthase family protein [Austwickia chelonae]GAB77288.1 3-oxoacyl-[acyl-carrier-protein] synthase II [Austwickia chelonae NBRC 105200]SEW07038.1 3-oxoacyl-[acyl-carrier-protein] synthase II [Austwickia chelonae]